MTTSIQTYRAELVPAPDAAAWGALKDMAATIVRSGIAPSGIDTTDKALVVLLTAREMSIPPMAAMQHAYVVKGKPQFSTQLLLALAIERIPGFQHEILVSEPKRAVVKMSRDGVAPVTIEFNEEMAKRAGVLSNSVWGSWGEDMYRWSATRKGLRLIGAGMGWVMAMPKAPDEEEPVKHEPSEATVLPDTEATLAAAVKPTGGPAANAPSVAATAPSPAAAAVSTASGAPSPAADASSDLLAVREIGVRLGYSFKGKGAAQRFTGFVNALSEQYALGIKTDDYQKLTSDEWAAVMPAALDYEKKKAGAGAAAVPVGTDADPALSLATGGAAVAPAVGAAPQQPVAPPAPTRYAESGAAALAASRGTPDAVVNACLMAEKRFAAKGRPRQFVIDHNDTKFFSDAAGLEACGFGLDVQDIYALNDATCAMLFNFLQAELDRLEIEARSGPDRVSERRAFGEH